MTRTADRIAALANGIIHDARRHPEWQRLNNLTEWGSPVEAENALHEMADVFEREIARLIDAQPADDREALSETVTTKLAQRCGLIA